jgi:hypothetical protein
MDGGKVASRGSQQEGRPARLPLVTANVPPTRELSLGDVHTALYQQLHSGQHAISGG